MARIDCPRCGKGLQYQSIKDLPYFPFCSERCKMVDLGLWLEEKHRISEDLLDQKPPQEAVDDPDTDDRERQQQT